MNVVESGNLSCSACVVKGKFQSMKDECSACGTIIYPKLGIIICHGSIFTEFALKNKTFASKIQNGQLITSEDIEGATFSILLNGQLKLQREKEVHDFSNLSLEPRSCKEHNVSELNNVKCEFVGAFRNDDFHTTVGKIMPKQNWLFLDQDDEGQDLGKDSTLSQVSEITQKSNSGLTFYLLSYFVILKCESVIQGWTNVRNTLMMPEIKLKECSIGQTAELITTPFGALCPSVFFNSYSRGVISNVSGKNNCWIITDARCIPGSEGGPVFVKIDGEDNTRYLSGIIVSSLCWKNNEWIGFSTACSVESIRQSMLELADSHLKPLHYSLSCISEESEHFNIQDEGSAGECFLSNTVLVQVGSTWGSGVIVDKTQGIIVTCSHVVKDAEHSAVSIRPYKSSFNYPASIIYRQKSLKGPYDIAVLKCCAATNHLPHDWSLHVSPPSIGQEVNVVGHAVFSLHLNLSPSWSRGVVSKVITHHTKPVLLQTTCAVHAGVSGGPVFTSDGKLVGIAICNTKDSSSNASFPHINMSVPFISIWPVLQHYLQTGDEEILSAMVLNNRQVSKLWSLGEVTCETSLSNVRSKL